MANLKELKRKIRSVKNIGQVTKALEMVSAVKMRKAQEALSHASPYYQLMNSMFLNLLGEIGEDTIISLFPTKKNVKEKKIAIIIISPSRGFAGSIISNLSKKILELIEKRSASIAYKNEEFIFFTDEEQKTEERSEKIDINLITVEKKSKEFALHLGKQVIADFPKLSNPSVFEDIIPMANIVIDGYKKAELDEIYVVYTHFLTTFTQRAVIQRILPFNFDALYTKEKEGEEVHPWYTYSTTQEQLFLDFYPTFIQTLLFHSVLDAAAAEHSARMIAMKNATDNATDLRKQYVFEYNQKRQASITQEIAEITSASDTI